MICKVIRRGGRGGGPTIEGEKEGDEEDRRRGGGRMCVDYDPSARTYATSSSLSLSSIHMSDLPSSVRGMKGEQISAAEKLKAIVVVLLHYCLVVGPFLLPLVDRRLPPSLPPSAPGPKGQQEPPWLLSVCTARRDEEGRRGGTKEEEEDH